MGRGESKAGPSKGGGNAPKTFSSNHKNNFEYENDNGETAKWFDNNSNVDTLIKNSTPDEQWAIRKYASGDLMYGQLYSGYDSLDGFDKKIVDNLDSIIDKSELKHDIQVTRLSTAEMVFGAGKGYGFTEADYNSHKGEVVNCPMFLSTGAANEGLGIGKRIDGATEYKIKVPKNIKGAGMWIGDSRVNGWGDQQREFVINRDCNFKIGSTKYDSTRKVFVTELELISRNNHDYGKGGK